MASASSEILSDERTPLLPITTNNHEETPRKANRSPSIIALTILCIAVVFALAAGFAVPAIVEEYATQAVVFEPENLAVESFTADGIRARIRGSIHLDASRVRNKPVRDIGRAATWIAREVTSGDAIINVYLPGYGDSLVATAILPPVTVNIRNLHLSHLDVLVDVVPKEMDGVQRLFYDFVDEKLRTIDVRAVVRTAISSGIFSLGTKSIIQNIRYDLEKQKREKFEIESLEITEHGPLGRVDGIQAAARVSAMNPYPASFDVPPIAFNILLPGCSGQYLSLGIAKSNTVHILPNQRVKASVIGFVTPLPASLTDACSGTNESPLDTFIRGYLEGKQARIFATGGEQDPSNTPEWLGELLRDMVIPLPVPSRQFDDLIKSFALNNVSLHLPEKNLIGAKPILSAEVNVVVEIPEHTDVNVDVHRVRATADVYYENQKLGELDLREWQIANSSKHKNELRILSRVVDAPLQITNNTVFAGVVRQMLNGTKGLTLGMKAEVDVDSSTALGQFIIRKVPTIGKVLIKPFGGKKLKYHIENIEVVESEPDMLTMLAKATFSNPTEYSADLPFVNISLWCNNTNFGHAWGNFSIKPGVNEVSAYASYKRGPVGRELMSQYLSGRNVTITVQTHEGSVPGLPNTELAIDFVLPHVFGKFLRDTTMHIFSSTATFVLFSPISMFVTSIAASAFYNGSDIGNIAWDSPFEVETGGTETPRLPVDWNNSGGFGLIRDALGGTLKLDARADVGVKIGEWEDTVWYEAKGIGAKIRI